MTPVNTITNKPAKAIKVRNYAAVIAVTPDGKTAYVTSVSNNVHTPGYVTPINTTTNTAGKAIEVGIYPDAIAVTPNGRTIYVANMYSHTVTPVNTATNTAGKPIRVPLEPDAVAVTPNGKTAYIVSTTGAEAPPFPSWIRNPGQDRHQHRREAHQGGDTALCHRDHP